MKIEFQLEATYLAEIHFKNAPVVLSESDIRYDINIDVRHVENADSVLVILSVSAKTEPHPKKDQFECQVTQVGIFKFHESETGQFKDQVDFKQFANINGAAILYPFIRQTVASVTSSSKTGLALLPLVNFVARWEGIKNKIIESV